MLLLQEILGPRKVRLPKRGYETEGGVLMQEAAQEFVEAPFEQGFLSLKGLKQHLNKGTQQTDLPDQ